MSDEDTYSTLFSSALLVFVGTAVGMGSKMGERILVGRLLEPGLYGEVSIGLAVLGISSTISLLGLFQGVPRFMARTDDSTFKRNVALSGILIAAVTATALAVVIVLVSTQLEQLLFDSRDSTRLLLLFAVALPLLVTMQAGVAGVRGLEKTVYKTVAQDLTYPLIRIAVIAGALVFTGSILAVGYGYIVAAVTGLVVVVLLLNRELEFRKGFTFEGTELVTFSLPLMISSAISTLLIKTDTVLVGFFRSSFETGLYAAAFPIANGLVLGLSAIGFLYLPITSRLDASDEQAQLNKFYQVTTKWAFLLTFPPFVLFTFFSEDVIRIFFGEAYLGANTALAVLSVGFFSDVFAGRSRETLISLGETRRILWYTGTAFGVNLLLNLLLIPRYGAEGAAIASACSFICLNVLAVWRLYMGHEITFVSKYVARTYIGLPLLVFPVAYVASTRIALDSVSFLFALIGGGVATLLGAYAVGGIQDQDMIVVSLLKDKFGALVE